jgi:type I restriction enzyme S subunit
MTDQADTVCLSDIAQIIPGTSPSGRDINDMGEGLPFFQGSKEFGTRYPRPERFTTAPVKTAAAGDILLSVRAPVGRVNIADTACAIGRGVMAVRPRDPADAPYIAAFLQMMGETWDAHATDGTMFANLSKVGLEQLPVRWPLMRRKIADVIEALDERIDVASRLIGSLSAAAQVLTSMAPSTCTISELARTERVQWDPEQHSGDIVDHYSLPAFDVGAGAERVEASAIASNKLQIRGPRVLFSRLNPDTNRTWLCAPSSEVTASVCSTEYAVLVAENTTVGQLWAVLSSGEVGDLLAAASTGTSASHQRVREDAVLGATVADPRSLSEADQHTIDAYAESVLEKVRELKALQEARDFLLPRLVSGELRVLAEEKLVEAAT